MPNNVNVCFPMPCLFVYMDRVLGYICFSKSNPTVFAKPRLHGAFQHFENILSQLCPTPMECQCWTIVWTVVDCISIRNLRESQGLKNAT